MTARPPTTGTTRVSTGTRIGAMAGTVLLTLLAVVATASPASAHARFLGSDPEEGTTVTALPDTIVMSYNEEIAPQFVDTAVVPPGGEPIMTESTAVGLDVVVDLAGAPGLVDVEAAAGEWQVVARVVSVDGHPVEHTTTFVLEPGAAPAPDPPAESEPTASAKPSTAAEPSAAPDPVAGQSPSSEPSVVTTDESTAGEVSQEPTAIAADPASGTLSGFPAWAGVAGVFVLLLAVVAGVLVYRRRQATSG